MSKRRGRLAGEWLARAAWTHASDDELEATTALADDSEHAVGCLHAMDVENVTSTQLERLQEVIEILAADCERVRKHYDEVRERGNPIVARWLWREWHIGRTMIGLLNAFSKRQQIISKWQAIEKLFGREA